MIFFYIVVMVFLATYAYGAVRGAPWLPTPRADVARLTRIVGSLKGKKVYDLGCGDGRMVCAAAADEAQAVGYEVSLLPYIMAKIRSAFVRGDVKIIYRDFWTVDLREADIVYCFLIPETMGKLKGKFERELRRGSYVISYVFEIPGWETHLVDEVENRHKMYTYRVR